MTSSVVGLRRSSKVLPKAKLAPEKGHGHCLVVCCPPAPLQLSKSLWNHYIWEVSSANWWNALKPQCLQSALSIERTRFFKHRWIAHCTTNASNVGWIGLQSFASSVIFTWPLVSWLLEPFLQESWQLFARKTLSQPAGGRTCFPRVRWIPKDGFWCYRNK